MKTFRSKHGPFREQPYFDDRDLESTAADELRKQNLLPSTPSPIRIERFVEKRFAVTVEPMDLGPGILGLTKFSSGGVVVGMYVSQQLDDEGTTVSKRRVRSTIAHEAGHGLLHAYLFALSEGKPLFGDYSDPQTPKVLCRDEGVEPSRTRYSGQWWEFQANAAMGHLLMPRILVEDAIQPFLIPTGSLGGRRVDPVRYELAVRSLSEIFDVNPAVARIRVEAYFPVKEGQLML